MSTKFNFILKFFLFVLCVFAVQLWVAKPHEIPNEIKLMDFFLTHGFDIVYLGDSTTNWAAESDKSKESMPGLLQRLLPTSKIAKIAHESYHMDVYEAYVAYLVRKKYQPRYVIIPISLRSFSPEWDRQPLWQFEREKFVGHFKDTLWMKFYHPLGVCKMFESPISRHAYEITPVYDGDTLIGRARDFDNPTFQNADAEKIKKKLQFRYMYRLTPQHRKIKSLNKIVDDLQSAGIRGVFYITPVDAETAVRYLGPDFIRRTQDNVNIIRQTLAKKGVDVLDLSLALGTQQFTWHEEGTTALYPNEHLKLPGRMMVVKALAERSNLRSYP